MKLLPDRKGMIYDLYPLRKNKSKISTEVSYTFIWTQQSTVRCGAYFPSALTQSFSELGLDAMCRQ